SDIGIAQTSYQLVARNRLWLPGLEEKDAIPAPTCKLSDLAEIGPLHRDINGTEYTGDVIRGPFEIVELPAEQEPTYPSLWNHNAEAERTLRVAPDSQAIIRKGKSKTENDTLRERAAKIWKSASRCHFNYDFRYNSQSTAACYTDRPCIG